jgi:hypothetical protein
MYLARMRTDDIGTQYPRENKAQQELDLVGLPMLEAEGHFRFAKRLEISFSRVISPCRC